MKLGFSLLEFVIGMMIGSMLLTETFVIYNGIAKSAQRVQKYSSVDTQLIIAQNRIQTDLNGLCPLWFDKQSIKSNKKNDTSADKEETKKPETVSKETDKDKPAPKIFFYAQDKDKNLDYFTFVTTNSLQMYGSDATPLKRVVYRLQADKQHQSLFMLTRQEIQDSSPDFDPKILETKKDQYSILNNIVSCSVKYGYIKETEQKIKDNKSAPKEQKKSDEKKEPEKRELAWPYNFKPQKTDQTIEKKETVKQPAIPKYIKITITCLVQNKEEKHELFFVIPINTSAPQESISKSMLQPKATQQSTTTNSTTSSAKNAQITQTTPTTPGAIHATP